MNMRKRTILLFLALVAGVIIVFFGTKAFATPPDNRPPDNRPPGGANVTVTTGSDSAANAVSSSESSASAAANATGGSATAAGGAASVNVNIGGSGDGEAGALVNDTSSNVFEGGDTNFNSESSNTNVVLVPNNNTAGCMRVYGFSFGNGDGAGGLGVPFRDKACDYELAADDAAAAGEHDIAWFWRCHKKHLWQAYRDRGESEEDAIGQCFEAMQDMLGLSAEPTSFGYAAPEAYMVAELSDEDAKELKEKVEELEKELEEREALIQQQQQRYQQLQQQQQQQQMQQQQQQQQIDQDAIRRQRAREILQKKEA
jgi:hypothetical protein